MSQMLRNMFVLVAGCWCLAAAPLMTGCSSVPRTATLNQAIASYNAHHYSAAHRHAVTALRTATGRERDQAAYLAGLCAYLTNDLVEAELRLTAASRSTDARTAGSARAMLGQLRLDQQRPGEAAVLFDTAARQLTGSDAAEARRYAAIAHQYAGNEGEVQRWASNQPYASTRSDVGGYALQVGAFSDRRRASAAASEAAKVADDNGLGPVSIVNSRDSRGRELYLVQFGRFASRTVAAQTRARLGHLQYIVAPRAAN